MKPDLICRYLSTAATAAQRTLIGVPGRWSRVPSRLSMHSCSRQGGLGRQHLLLRGESHEASSVWGVRGMHTAPANRGCVVPTGSYEGLGLRRDPIGLGDMVASWARNMDPEMQGQDRIDHLMALLEDWCAQTGVSNHLSRTAVGEIDQVLNAHTIERMGTGSSCLEAVRDWVRENPLSGDVLVVGCSIGPKGDCPHLEELDEICAAGNSTADATVFEIDDSVLRQAVMSHHDRPNRRLQVTSALCGSIADIEDLLPSGKSYLNLVATRILNYVWPILDTIAGRVSLMASLLNRLDRGGCMYIAVTDLNGLLGNVHAVNPNNVIDMGELLDPTKNAWRPGAKERHRQHLAQWQGEIGPFLRAKFESMFGPAFFEEFEMNVYHPTHSVNGKPFDPVESPIPRGIVEHALWYHSGISVLADPDGMRVDDAENIVVFKRKG